MYFTHDQFFCRLANSNESEIEPGESYFEQFSLVFKYSPTYPTDKFIWLPFEDLVSLVTGQFQFLCEPVYGSCFDISILFFPT